MMQPPSPPIQPFERLQVTDGLLINAERWRQSHDYHRQRQNLHYQSINQAGVVCGLGVFPVTAPEDVAVQYRDGRWVQIQPGIAIDLAGNPIVVPEKVDFRIAADTRSDTPLLVYLVLSYVDPDKLSRQERREFLQETFRIDEKTSPPEAHEVEICRILLRGAATGQRSKPIQLEPALDVFAPTYNQVDLRYRLSAQPKAQSMCQVACWSETSIEATPSFSPWFYLLQSVPSLYPAMNATEAGHSISLGNPSDIIPPLSTYDLIYYNHAAAIAPLSETAMLTLKSYLQQGGVLLVDAESDNTSLMESVLTLAQSLGITLESFAELDRHHPLRTQPFLFSALPKVGREAIQLALGGGIILVRGPISAAWGLDPELSCSREVIRSAHEFGINLLFYAYRRHKLTRLARREEEVSVEQTQAAKPASTVFDRLL